MPSLTNIPTGYTAFDMRAMTDDERRIFAAMHPERGFTESERDPNVTLIPWKSISPVRAELERIYAAIEARR